MRTRLVEVEAKAEIGTSVEEMETSVKERLKPASMIRKEVKGKTVIRWY